MPHRPPWLCELARVAVPKPNFFIVGAPKCGTTSLHGYLQPHPDVYLPYYKEPHFFGRDLEGSRFEQFRGKPRRYLKLFRDARDERLRGESSPWYLVSRCAAAEIHAYDPQAKIIIMLRNPVDMLYSLWSQFRYSGNEQIESFEQALAAEEGRRAGRQIRRAAHCITGLCYRHMARFSEQVARYFQHFGRERVKVIIFDDFRADTATVYCDVLRFLGVDDSFRVDFSVRNPNKSARLPWLRNLIVGSGFSLMLLKDRMTYFTSTNSLVPYARRTRVVDGVVAVYTRYERRSPLTADTSRQLALELAPEVDKLSALLDRDLSHWTRRYV